MIAIIKREMECGELYTLSYDLRNFLISDLLKAVGDVALFKEAHLAKCSMLLWSQIFYIVQSPLVGRLISILKVIEI